MATSTSFPMNHNPMGPTFFIGDFEAIENQFLQNGTGLFALPYDRASAYCTEINKLLKQNNIEDARTKYDEACERNVWTPNSNNSIIRKCQEAQAAAKQSIEEAEARLPER